MGIGLVGLPAWDASRPIPTVNDVLSTKRVQQHRLVFIHRRQFDTQHAPDVRVSHGFPIIWIAAAHHLARAIRASHQASGNRMTM
jgi:hypothetical protein